MNAAYSGAMVVEAANYGYKGIYKDYENRPKGFVLHTPEEPADDHMFTPYYFATTDRPASTHYFVSYHGFVIQCVPENEGAYANALEGKPAPVWLDRPNLNLATLSVEIEGYAATIADTISPAQKTALLNLIRHRCQAYGIPLDRQHIIGHYEVANNRSDPGTLNIDAIVAELQTEDDMTPEQDARLKRVEGKLDRLDSITGWWLSQDPENPGAPNLITADHWRLDALVEQVRRPDESLSLKETIREVVREELDKE